MGVDQATAEHPRVTGTNVTPLPPLRPSVPELRQGVCEKALRLAADSPDISAKLGLTHVQNLSEVGPAQATHDKLKRFYVQWAKMWMPTGSVTVCVDDESPYRESLVIWDWYLFARDGYRGFDFVQALPGVPAALARIGSRTVLLRFSRPDGSSGRPAMTAHEIPKVEPTDTATNQ